MRVLALAAALLLTAGPAPAQPLPDKETDREGYQALIPALGALDRGDVKQVIDSLRPLAADGTLEAQYVLATILETAPPPHRDLAAARQWYESAAELGHAGAQNNLGAMYFDGRVVGIEHEGWFGACPRVVDQQGFDRRAAEQPLHVDLGIGQKMLQEQPLPRHVERDVFTRFLHAREAVFEHLNEARVLQRGAIERGHEPEQEEDRGEAACRDQELFADPLSCRRLERSEAQGGLDHERAALAAGQRDFDALAPHEDSLAGRRDRVRLGPELDRGPEVRPAPRLGDRELRERQPITYPAEQSNLPLVSGTVVVKPVGAAPPANGPELVILLRPQPAWAGQVTVLGQVVRGFDVAQGISRLPTSGQTQRPFFKPLNDVTPRRIAIKELPPTAAETR